MMQNPAVMAQLQAHLSGMEGMSSGYLEGLAPAVKRRVKALKRLQAQNVQVEVQLNKEIAILEKKYAVLFKPLYEKRTSIISGKYEPTDAESVWVDPHEEEEEGGEAEAEAAESSTDPKLVGIPGFWLTIFEKCDPLAQRLEEHDVDILEHLEDVTSELLPEGYRLDFHFSPNEFFTNKVLSLTFIQSIEHDADELLFEGPESKGITGTVINWNKGKDVTFKMVTKKQKKKGGSGAGKVRTVTKRVELPSFFHIFASLPVRGEEEEEDEAAIDAFDSKLDELFEIGGILRDRIIPNAVLYFTGEAEDYEQDGDGGEGEEEEDEENGGEGDEDDDDGPAAPVPRAGLPPPGEKPPECKQQ